MFHRTVYRDYGVSTAGKAIFWTADEFFLMYFLTDVAHLTALCAGFAACILLLGNALCDALVGWWHDRRSAERFPSRRYFQVCCGLMMTFFVAGFCWLPAAHGDARALLAIYVLFYASYSAMDVPHNTFLSHLAADGRDRTHLSVARFGACVFSAVVITAAARQISRVSGSDGPVVFFVGAVLLAFVGGTLFLRFLPRLPDVGAIAASPVAETPAGESSGVPTAFPLMEFYISAFAVALIMAGIARSIIYVCKYVFASPEDTAAFFALYLAGKILSMPVLLWLAGRVTPWRLLRWSYEAVAVVSVLAMAIPPDRGLFAVSLLLEGMALGLINQTMWSLLPVAAAAENRWGHSVGVRLFGTFTAVSKIAAGAGGLLLGYVLSASDFGRSVADVALSRRLDLAFCIAAAVGLAPLCLNGRLSRLVAACRRRPSSAGSDGPRRSWGNSNV